MNAQFQTLIEQCKSMLTDRHTTEDILLFLRSNNCSKIDSIRALILLKDISLREAKETVHFSETWKDTKDTDEKLHAGLEAILSDDQIHN